MDLKRNQKRSGKQIIYLLFACIGFLTSCQSDKDYSATEIILANSSPVVLNNKAIAIVRDDLSLIPDGNFYPLILNTDKDTIPAQLDDTDGDGIWDELFFLMNLDSNSEERVYLRWISTPLEFEKRTSVRFGVRSSLEDIVHPAQSDTFFPGELPWIMGYQPYQTDGPSWENDKVGFRHYLDGRNSKDVFGKKVSYMSPDTVGINTEGVTEDNYHVMEDWGRDILSVGNSVGIGGVALMIGEHLVRIGVMPPDTIGNVESTTYRILSEGPVRSIMNFSYANWKPMDQTYGAEEITSIWPGMYAYKNSVSFSGLQGNEKAMIGLVNINTDKPLVEIKASDKSVILLVHDKQTYDKEWWLGLALILPADAYLGYMEAPETGNISNSYLAELKINNESPLDYYAVACWELSDQGFRNEDYFKEYVRNLVIQLETEVQLTIK